MNLVAYLATQQRWSTETFGPGARTAGIVKHIQKELLEIQADPSDVREWIDVVILALDGAWRAGYTPEEVVAALVKKLGVNLEREWPAPGLEDEAIEHIRKE